MLPIAKRVTEIEGLTPRSLTDDILKSTKPLLLKGLVGDWPMTRAGRESFSAADAYLRKFGKNSLVRAMLAKPEEGGRFFYNEDFTGFNYAVAQTQLVMVLDELRDKLDDDRPPAIYVGSTSVDLCLPGFRMENDLDLGKREPLISIWLGNRSRIAAHFDFPDNIACVVAGRRRFTLFPPDQLRNLYVGPLDITPAGQAISMVDFNSPDFAKFPKFREALNHAQVAELEPGDAVFIPSSWWHHVEALESFNILINYWWARTPAYMSNPVNALMLAILAVRDLPPEQRKTWAEFFRHYVFEADEETASHIPPQMRKSLAPINAETAHHIRANLVKKLSR